MRKIIFCIGAILSNTLVAQVQEQNNKYNLKIKSPDASQLSKHIDIPTTTHTGTIGIDIPIYNIKVDDFNLPISLKYHASGIKVKDVASKVGLGWSLSVGGVSLSKQIIGSEDKGHIPVINQADGAFDPNDRTSSDYSSTSQIMGFNSRDPSDIYTYLGQKRDTQPDIFSYSMGNNSGDFYLDSTGKPLKIGETSLKIEVYPFIFTDEYGNKYFFSAGNEIRTVGGSLPTVDNLVVTDFIIDKILLVSGKEIKFEYQPASPYNYLSYYYKGYTYPLQCSTSNDGVAAQEEYNEYASLTEVLKEKYLSKITYPDGYTTFTYNSNREDIINGLSLDKISAYDNNNRLIINQQLIKSYFTSTDVKNIIGYASQADALTKRLKLSEVKNTLDNSFYKLSYYENKSLPNRLSDATDYVGYFNGSMANMGIPYTAIDDNVYGFGDNKNPNINFAVSGSLKEIIYPTGGKMNFEYELDDFDSNYFPPEIAVSQKDELILSEELEKIFTVNTTAARVSFKINFNSTINPDNDGSGSLPVNNNPYFIGEILDAATNGVLKTFLLNGDYEFLLDKKPSYKLRIRKYKNPSIEDYASLSVKWFEKSVVPSSQNKSVGGIRVKKIAKQDNSNNVLEERFIYKDENGLSTGVFMGDPINYYNFSSSPLGYEGESCRKLVISNSGNFNLSTINGKPTVYNKVITEKVNINNPNEKWKTIDTYYNAPSTNFYNNEIPFQTFVNNHFSRGILIRKEMFNSNNTIVNKIENEYDSDQFFNQKSSDYNGQFPLVTIRPYQFRITKITKERDMMSGDFFYIPTFEFTRYDITSSWMKLKARKTTIYFTNNELKETTTYSYNKEHKHINPMSIEVRSPDGTISETTYQYAHEKGNQLMIDKNMIGIPLETTTTQTVGSTTKTLSRAETIYPLNQSEANTKSSGLVLPLSVISYDNLNGNPSTEVKYDKYNEKGNILQYTTKEGIPVSIVWGYNQTQPIAKIEGMVYADLLASNLITNIVSKSNDDAADPTKEELLVDALNDFRKQTVFVGKQVSTFTYDPLIGVTSITPPSGIREVYVYDTANRLKEVKVREKDASGNYVFKKVKEYNYNYKQ